MVKGEGLNGAIVSVKWNMESGEAQWFQCKVITVKMEDYGRHKGHFSYHVIYDDSNSKAWSLLDKMVHGEVGDGQAEWSLVNEAGEPLCRQEKEVDIH